MNTLVMYLLILPGARESDAGVLEISLQSREGAMTVLRFLSDGCGCDLVPHQGQ